MEISKNLQMDFEINEIIHVPLLWSKTKKTSLLATTNDLWLKKTMCGDVTFRLPSPH